MKNILIVCPGFRDRFNLPRLQQASEFRFIYFEQVKEPGSQGLGIWNSECLSDYQLMIKGILSSLKGYSLDGVMSSNDTAGCVIASLIAQQFKVPGPDPAIVLTLLHKYQSRLVQKQFVPEATPPFSLLTMDANFDGPYPVFIKPVRGNFSKYSGIMHTKKDIQMHTKFQRPPVAFMDFFSQLLADHTQFKVEPDWFLAEEFLEGQQVCLEGFVYNGEVQVLGIVDAHMYPGTTSFERFEYPSVLEESVQLRMVDITKRVMSGVNFDNGFFNIELIYDPKKNRISIIEINPRIASQFADLFQKVDGENTYQMLLDIAIGNKPKFNLNKGCFNYAASCALRIFNDAYVESVPAVSDIASIQHLFPEVHIEICCTKGKRLSQSLQDGMSFRYALVHLGGGSREEIKEKLRLITAKLNFKLCA